MLLSPWKKRFEQHSGDFSTAFLLAAAAQGPKVPEHFGGRLRLLRSFLEQVSTDQAVGLAARQPHRVPAPKKTQGAERITTQVLHDCSVSCYCVRLSRLHAAPKIWWGICETCEALSTEPGWRQQPGRHRGGHQGKRAASLYFLLNKANAKQNQPASCPVLDTQHVCRDHQRVAFQHPD